MFFEHKLSVGDFDAGTLTFKNVATNSDIDVRFDFCVGADGSYSNVRRQLMRVVRSVHFCEHTLVGSAHMWVCATLTEWTFNRHTFHTNI